MFSISDFLQFAQDELKVGIDLAIQHNNFKFSLSGTVCHQAIFALSWPQASGVSDVGPIISNPDSQRLLPRQCDRNSLKHRNIPSTSHRVHSRTVLETCFFGRCLGFFEGSLTVELTYLIFWTTKSLILQVRFQPITSVRCVIVYSEIPFNSTLVDIAFATFVI